MAEALPDNFREGCPWKYLPTREHAARVITTEVKLEMGWPLVVDDVLGIEDKELLIRALTAFGTERLINEAGFALVDRDEEGELLGMGDMVFVHEESVSSSGRYLLRVPPDMQTVRQAIAWTFGFDNVEDYHPMKET